MDYGDKTTTRIMRIFPLAEPASQVVVWRQDTGHGHVNRMSWAETVRT